MVQQGMARIRGLLLIAMLLLAAMYYTNQFGPEPVIVIAESGPVPGAKAMEPSADSLPEEGLPKRAVLDITVHTIEELKVLFDRAEELAMTPRSAAEEARVVLVLHGPEVEFFSISNYDKYKDVVDQAARLDAFDVVDVKICQTMMEISGIPRDDIPSFIDQVPLGSAEVERLTGEGYVYF